MQTNRFTMVKETDVGLGPWVEQLVQAVADVIVGAVLGSLRISLFPRPQRRFHAVQRDKGEFFVTITDSAAPK